MRYGTGIAAAALMIWASPVSAELTPVASLEETLQATLDFNEALEIAGEDVEQASLRRKRYLMSLTPDLTLQGYDRRVEGGAPGGDGGGPVFFPEGTYYGYSFTLSQPLYTGGRAIAAYRGAGEQEKALMVGEEIVRRDLLVGVAEVYYASLAAMETVRIGEQAVVRARRHLELAEKRLELGEGVRTDLLRSEVNLAEVQSRLVGYRRILADARDRVRRFCGRPLADGALPGGAFPPVRESLEELVQEALERRPEVEQDRFAVGAAEEDVREKKGRFLPALYAAGSYYGSGDEIDRQVTGWDAGLYVEFPIYQRASRFYLLRESRSALRQTMLRSESRERDIALEVSGLYNALQASEANLDTLRKQVELAEENQRLSEKRFSVGLADSLETVDTQTALIEAQIGLEAEKLRHEVAKLRLVRAVGREVFPGVRGEKSE